MKREGASTLFIHGYPLALSYLFRSLAFLFNCLKWCSSIVWNGALCVIWKDILKRGHRCGNLCNDSCLNVYKGVFVFWKDISMFDCLKVCFEKCFEIVLWSVFENSKDVFASFDQVTKSCLPYFTQRFFSCFNPFKQFCSTIAFGGQSCVRMFNGTGAGHRMDHDCNGAKYLWETFPLRDLIIFD